MLEQFVNSFYYTRPEPLHTLQRILPPSMRRRFSKGQNQGLHLHSHNGWLFLVQESKQRNNASIDGCAYRASLRIVG